MKTSKAVRRLASLACMAVAGVALAAPPTQEEIVKLCVDADGPAHCGRLIEGMQLKRLPNLAAREGDTLTVRLFPSGEAKLVDRETLRGGDTYSLFDYISEFNAVVLWVTHDDESGFLLLQRASGSRTPLPSQPVAAPGGARFATADFCPARCENQVVVWRVGRDGAQRELSWKPAERWNDATVRWKDVDIVQLEYTREGEDKPRTLERRVADPSWTRVEAR